MSTILVSGNAILGVNPLDDGTVWRLADLVVPKAGQQVVSGVTLPTDWAPGKYTWSGTDFEAVPMDAALLLALQTAKNTEINEARWKANTSTFEHAGKLIACDQLSRSDIDGVNGYVALYGALPPGWPGGWKAADNTILVIADVAAWKAFYSSMVAAGNANFAYSQTLKASLASATTEAQVAAIKWGNGP